MGKWMNRILDSEEPSEFESHLSPEDLACFVEGKIQDEKREDMIRHINRCRRCYDILDGAMTDLVQEASKTKKKPKFLYALAASIFLAVCIGGGLFFYNQHVAPPGIIMASLSLDPDLKSILLENETTRWEKADRIVRLAEMLRKKGVKVKKLIAVVQSAPYFARKDLFGPKEVLHVRIENGVAHLRIEESPD